MDNANPPGTKPLMRHNLTKLTLAAIAEEPNMVQGMQFGSNNEIRHADKILRAGDWELQIAYLLKGARSEGLHSVLLNQGQVVGAERYAVIDTELGARKYYAEIQERKCHWDISGWNFVDPDARRKRRIDQHQTRGRSNTASAVSTY